MTRLLVFFAAALTAAGAAAEAPPVPRYKFEPGQEMTYRSAETFAYGEGKYACEIGSRTDWTVWVARANKDGSFRLVIRHQEVHSQVAGGKKHEQPGSSRLVYADVFPDGRVVSNETFTYRGHPGPIFPRLPKDAAEAARGWSWERDGEKITAKPLKADKAFRFETATDSPLNAIYLSTYKAAYTFDPAQGRVTAARTARTQGFGVKGKGTGTTELLGVKASDPTLGKQLAAEEGVYFDAVAAHNRALEAATALGPDEAKKRLKAAGAALAAVKLTHPLLKAELEQRVKGHDQSVAYRLQEIARRAKVVGKPAEAFVVKDIDGKVVKLADLKGKVVVLDFWYRGCGWCIKAMPQINGLAEDFAGQPVAVLGMNTDHKEEDARFVIEKMGLKYPTLKATGLPEKFGVQGFPTLILIDPQGKVHDVHVGYTPTLRKDVGRQIKALLAKK
jgi:peroxiredoxin